MHGTVCSIAIMNAREKDGQGPWKIAVAYRTSDDKPVATKLVLFEVTMNMLNGENNDTFIAFIADIKVYCLLMVACCIPNISSVQTFRRLLQIHETDCFSAR